MKYLLSLIVVCLLMVGCAKDAEAGDPVQPVQRVYQVQQVQQCCPPQAQMTTVMQTRKTFEMVPEEYEVTVEKTRMVPETYTEVQKHVRYNRVEKEVEVPVQMMMVPVQEPVMAAVQDCPTCVYAAPAPTATVYRAAPVRTCLQRICDRHAERKAARQARRAAPRTLVMVEAAPAPAAYGYGIEK